MLDSAEIADQDRLVINYYQDSDEYSFEIKKIDSVVM
jgi:hypothetical protein